MTTVIAVVVLLIVGTVVVLLIVGTVVFSAYEEYTTVRSEFAGGANQPVAGVSQNGNMATVSINFTIPNKGLYTLDVTLACGNSNPNVVCTAGHVSVPPGGEQVLRFKMTITNIQQYVASSSRRINGTVTMAFEPYVSLAIGTDLSGLVKVGGP